MATPTSAGDASTAGPASRPAPTAHHPVGRHNSGISESKLFFVFGALLLFLSAFVDHHYYLFRTKLQITLY